jgi:chromosome segregation ATPase
MNALRMAKSLQKYLTDAVAKGESSITIATDSIRQWLGSPERTLAPVPAVDMLRAFGNAVLRERYLKKKRSHLEAQQRALENRAAVLSGANDDLITRNTVLAAENVDLSSKLQDADAKLEIVTADNRNAIQSAEMVENSLRRRFKQVQDQQSAREAECERLKAELSTMKSIERQLRASITDIANSRAQLELKTHSLATERDAERAKVKDLEGQMSSSSRTTEQSRKGIDKLLKETQDKYEARKAENERFRSDLIASRLTIAVLENRVKDLTEATEGLLSRNAELALEKEAYQARNQTMEKQNTDALERLHDVEDGLIEKEHVLQELKRVCSFKQYECDLLKMDLAAAEGMVVDFIRTSLQPEKQRMQRSIRRKVASKEVGIIDIRDSKKQRMDASWRNWGRAAPPVPVKA